MFSQKSPRFPGNGTFLYFGKSIFRGALSIFRTMTSLESWHIQNLGIFLTQGIIRTPLNIYDGTFYKNSFLVHIRKVLLFSYASENGNPEETSNIFSKESFSYNSGSRNLEKIRYISGNGTLLHFRKGIFRTLT